MTLIYYNKAITEPLDANCNYTLYTEAFTALVKHLSDSIFTFTEIVSFHNQINKNKYGS